MMTAVSTITHNGIFREICAIRRFGSHSLSRLVTRKYLLVLFIVGLALPEHIEARTNPPCANNIRYPRIPVQIMCAETVIDYSYVPGLASITELTFGPDGSLYFARPVTSEIIRIRPDQNGFIEAPYTTPQIFASSLPEPPNGLTYYDGAWYVAGDTTITRLRDTDQNGVADEQQVIVKGLPGGAGGWLGNIRVGPDKRLYVAKAASCDACVEIDTRRGALLSFALDGSPTRCATRCA